MNKAPLFRLPFLGAVAGTVSAATVLWFRWFIEDGQRWFLPDAEVGNYESLPLWARFLLPAAGGLFLGLAFSRLPPQWRRVGILHVYRRLHASGPLKMPLGNAVVQFFGGAAALISGQSVDREGPGVHLGAASAYSAHHTFNPGSGDDRTLAACGAAASIAAAFNTPLAGIIFVIEVLDVRYDISRFLPVMMASVIGAVMGRLTFGAEPAFTVPPIGHYALDTLLWIIPLGLAIGLVASLFIGAVQRINAATLNWSTIPAFTLAGLVTGLLAIPAPEIMGISYDSLERMLDGEFVLSALLVVLTCKFTATALSIGVRIPGGLIGPSLVIGGAMGSIAGTLISDPVPAHASIYPVVGMVAMMGATLQAPLAAVTALLELTARPEAILPGTIAVIGADLVSRLIIGSRSVFATLAATDPPEEPD